MSVNGIAHSNQGYFAKQTQNTGANLAMNQNAGTKKVSTDTGEPGTDTKAVGITHDLYVGKYSDTSVNSLRDSFGDYDNTEAVMKAHDSIDSRYNSTDKNSMDDMFKLLKPNANNADLQLTIATRDEVEAYKTQAIDKWLKGESTFNSFMLGGVSSSGFRVLETEDNRHLFEEAGKILDENATADEIAQKKEAEKQIAALTPNDMGWMDSTGLQALTLEERNEFRDGMNLLFKEAGIDANAHSIGFDFAPNGDIFATGVKDEELDNQIKDMFNNHTGLSEESIDLANRLKELGKRNGEMNIDILA